MKKLLSLLLLLCASRIYADTALIQLGPDGRPIALPINSPVVDTTTVQPVTVVPAIPPPEPPKTPVEIGTLPPVFPKSYIYYTIPAGPLGEINLVTPWSAAIAAEGYDFIGKEAITQGYLPFFHWKKITGVGGAGIDGRGNGSPLAGGLVDLANVQIAQAADLHFIVSGGYNINERHALAIFSASVQFLK